MSKLKNISDQAAGKAAMVAGTAFAAEGVVQLVHPQNSGSKVVGLAGHLVISFFIVALITMAPAVIALGRYARPGRAEKIASAVAASTTLLGLTSITSLAMSHDGVWFNVIAPLTNAVWLFGSIALAVSLKRAGRVATAIGVGLPVAWIGTIPMATVGGGLISGAYFLTLGYLLAQDALAPVGARVAMKPRFRGAAS
jgi:hypothetical protein